MEINKILKSMVKREVIISPEVKSKIWNYIHYCPRSTNCGNCENADKDSWDEDTERGVCTVLKKLTFPVFAWGICKLHTDLSISKK